MSDILLAPVAEQLRRLSAGEVTASGLLELTFARIDALNPRLNVVIHQDRQAARTAAAQSDARYREGRALPLDGLPITIKDALDVAGMVSTAGSPAFKDRVPTVDAVAVARVRQAGAVILGKTNVPVFSGDFQSFNPLHGVTRHPWDDALSPGGSSGGAAVAVATGMASFELGSDQGSSIRWPAATTGIVGLKTSWGLVSNWGLVPPPPDKRPERSVEVVTVGPLARHAADLDLILPVIVGGRDPQQKAPPLKPPRHPSATGLRVAVWPDEPLAPVDDEVRDGVRYAADLLKQAGAGVTWLARAPVPFAEVYEVFALLNHWLVGYGLPARVRDKIAGQAGRYAPGDLAHQALQARGMRMTPGLHQQLDARRQRLMRQWAHVFTQHDVVLCPPAPVASLAHDHDPNIMARPLLVNGAARPYLDFLLWAAPAAGANLPAAVAPAGSTASGTPRGVQIIAPFMEDRTAIVVAGLLQALQGGYRPPPGLG